MLKDEFLAALTRKTSSKDLKPVEKADRTSSEWTPLGIERLTQGKVGTIILAGGQGSRLGADVPKALFPLGSTTLLEILLNKIIQASEFYQTKIPCAIIVSRDNQAPIADYLKAKKFENFTTLIIQDEAPLMDDAKNWVHRADGTVATAPDGNGHALQLLQRAGLLEQWKKRGVEDLTIVQIDNPLADPVDPIFIGYHVSHPADVTLKVIYRQNNDEKVGVIVEREGRIEVCEYMELPEDRLPLSRFANIGMYALTLDFAGKVASRTFPWHATQKVDPKSKKLVWKFERFIFDMLLLSQKTNLLQYPREDVYAPLKGSENIVTVQAAIEKLISK